MVALESFEASQGKRLIIVEDEWTIVALLETILADIGFDIAGVAPSVDRALRILEEKNCDAAVLDANLAGESSEPVALALERLGIPFVVLSGYASDQRRGALAKAPYCPKPVRTSVLKKALFSVLRSTTEAGRA